MIGYPEAAAIVGVSFSIAFGLVKNKTNGICKLHAPLMSDIASIKSAMVSLSVYVLKESEQEGRDLQQEIINAMMKK